MGEVDAAVLGVDPLAARIAVNHREDQAAHFLRVDRAAVERPQRAVYADNRRTADLQMEIAPFQLHQCAEKLVDLDFPFGGEGSLRLLFGLVVGGGHGEEERS